jgi:hypothetical protein
MGRVLRAPGNFNIDPAEQARYCRCHALRGAAVPAIELLVDGEDPSLQQEALISLGQDLVRAGVDATQQRSDTIVVSLLISELPATAVRTIHRIVVSYLRRAAGRTVELKASEDDKIVLDASQRSALEGWLNDHRTD